MITTDKSAYYPHEKIIMTIDPPDRLFISPINPGQDTLAWKIFLGRAPSVPGLYAIGTDHAGIVEIGTIIKVFEGPAETVSKYSFYPVAAVVIALALVGAGAAYAYKKFRWG